MGNGESVYVGNGEFGDSMRDCELSRELLGISSRGRCTSLARVRGESSGVLGCGECTWK